MTDLLSKRQTLPQNDDLFFRISETDGFLFGGDDKMTKNGDFLPQNNDFLLSNDELFPSKWRVFSKNDDSLKMANFAPKR